MKAQTLAYLGLAATATATAPKGSAPDGCSPDHSGTFEITAAKVVSSKAKREDLVLTLSGGVLKDAHGRIGYIASNYQFQFDNPVQPGTIYDSGFSACNNGSIALGSSAVFWECKSGDFYNLYDRYWANTCSPVELVMMGGSSGSGGEGVTQKGDGQPNGGPPVTQKGDGQPNGGPPVTEKGDGQPNAPTGSPVTEKGDGQPNAPTGSPVTEKGDGQPNAPTGSPVTEKGDGQPNAPTGSPVTEKGDGQPNAPTGAPVTEKGDGQPNAPTGAPVTEKGDGQPNAPASTAAAGNNTMATMPKPTPSTQPSTVPASNGNKAAPLVSAALFIAGLGAVLYL